MTCVRRNLNNRACCNSWQKGIRTINSQYPDDNREFKIAAGAGILITPITAGILITNTTDPDALEAGSNIELTPNGDHLQIGVVDGPVFEDDTTINADLSVNGDLNVNGNIYNQGASYESHMEQVYTTDDYIIMRDNAVTGLAAGTYAGFQVKLYDGVNDGRLVIDNSGTARVGDAGDEQPLLTREESANLTDGAILKWDAANSKAVDEGSVGDDTHPVKIVNGIATPVTSSLGITNTLYYYNINSTSCPAGQYTPLASFTATETGNYLLIGFVEIQAVGTHGSDTYGVGFNINGVNYEQFNGDVWPAAYGRTTISNVTTLNTGETAKLIVTPGSTTKSVKGNFSVIRLS